jgi:Lipocalin-like domain
MRIVLLLLFAVTSPAFASETGLIGNWKLLSYQLIVENEAPQDIFGTTPKGYLILTREGRMAGIVTGDNRKFGISDAELSALLKSMIAYSGKYRVEGKDFITTVDVSWNEKWNGTEQQRTFRIEGEKLFIESAPAPVAIFGGKSAVGRLVWEREK